MQRTVIELSKDGNLLFTRQARSGIGGSAKERRRQQRDGFVPEWKRTARVIARPGKPIPESVALLYVPGDPEIAAQAQENAEVALLHSMHADAIVAAIEKQQASFAVETPRKCVVTISYE